MQFTIFTIEQNQQILHLLTPLSREQLPNQIQPYTFAGRLKDPLQGPTPENVEVNPEFLVLLHAAVRDIMATDPEVQEQAKTQLNGFVFIVDRRAPEGEDVDKADIIGIFLVNEHKTDATRYRPNPDYRLVGEHGLALLPKQVEEELLRKLIE